MNISAEIKSMVRAWFKSEQEKMMSIGFSKKDEKDDKDVNLKTDPEDK